ncbi:TIGR03619 family F420-dependent LLM class oxidoreductase [Mycobacterium colombiense]
MSTHTAALRAGITIPFFDHQSDYSTILRVAKRTQEAGFDSVWMADHLTRRTPQGAGRWFDVVTLLSNIVGHCEGLMVGTDILVVPYRHPVLTAKMLATLDVVSGGRLIVGTGVGYIEEEFEDLAAPFADRGDYTTESIEVWRKIWAGGSVSHDGKFFSFTDVIGDHRPTQRPGPPVWIGGTVGASLRRVVAVGDGWHPIYLPFSILESSVRRLHELSEEAGRAEPITLSYSGGFGSVQKDAVDDPARPPLVGGVQQVLEDIDRLRQLGFSNIIFRFGSNQATNDHVLAQIDFVAEHILPAMRE